MAGIKHMFQTSLLYAAQSSVRTAAVRAYVAFMCENEDDDKVLKSLSDQIPAVIQASFLKRITCFNEIFHASLCSRFVSLCTNHI